MASNNQPILSQLMAILQSIQQPALPGAATPTAGVPSLADLLSGQAPVLTAQQYANNAAGTSTAPDLVWLGDRVKVTPEKMPMNASQLKTYTDMKVANDATYNGANGRKAVTADAALNLPFTWDEKQREAAYKRVGESTGQPIQSFDQFNAAWQSAAKVAAQSWAATEGGKTGSPLTVWDVFDLAKREGAKYGFANAANGGAGSGPRTTTSTSSSVEKLSDGSTWQILKGAATQALGRAPTHDELQRFASKANQIASSNPTKTTTTTTSSAGGSSSHSNTQQGASAGDYELAAEDQINSDPEAGAFQAATTYADALFRGLASPV